jgi:3-isopropylmalate dehydratase small subunit
VRVVEGAGLNNGLLPIQISDTSKIDPGDELLIDLDARSLLDVTKGTEYQVVATDAAVEQMKRGGFLGYVRERLRQQLRAPAQ